MEYYCSDTKCAFLGTKPYVLNIPQEVCVDEHNLAMMYCPYCKSKLVKKQVMNQAPPSGIASNCTNPC